MNIGSLTSARVRDGIVLVSLLNGGNEAAVVQRVKTLAAGKRGGYENYCLGVAHARLGDIAQAVNALLAIPAGDAFHSRAQRLALNLLHRDALHNMKSGDVLDAITSLGQALKIDPENQELEQLMARLEHSAPVANIVSGRREEAVAAWEKLQARDARDGRVTHSLALACRFSAESLESKQKRTEAASAWRKAIANWSTLTYNDSFWSTWTAERGIVYSIPEEAVAKLRESWEGQLVRRLQGLIHQHEGKGAAGEIYVRLEFEYWLERMTAAALLELAKVRCSSCKQLVTAVPAQGQSWKCGGKDCGRNIPEADLPHNLPPLGPIALEHLGLLQQAKSVASKASRFANGQSLTGVLSKLSLPFIKTNADILIFCLDASCLAFAAVASGRYLQALSELESAKRASAPIHGKLMMYASLERGKQIVNSAPALPSEPSTDAEKKYLEPRRLALACWEKTRDFQTHDADLKEEILKRIEALAVAVGNEVMEATRPFTRAKNWARDIGLLTSGIDFMRSAQRVAARDRIAITLAVLLQERALSRLTSIREAKNDVKQPAYTLAIADYEEAMKLQPNDAKIKKDAAQTYNGRGCLSSKHAALADFKKAAELDSSEPLYLANRAVSYLEIEQPDEAIQDLIAACKIERRPDWVNLAASAFNMKGLSYVKGHSQYNPIPSWKRREAAENFKAAMDLDPSNQTFRDNYNIVTRG